ncbi:MAG: protein translocase subunit SecF [Firmicutes bacterium]|nr:protein translocase subunit SecF [Bacillota bacterium]
MEEQEKNVVNKEKKAYMGLVSKFKDPSFKIAKKGKWYALVPALLVVIGLIVALTVGMNLGLDFTGGYVLRVNNLTDPTEQRQEVRNIFTQTVNADSRDARNIQAQVVGDSVEIRFTFRGDADMTDDIIPMLNAALVGAGIAGEFEGGEFISAAQSMDRVVTTIIAVVAALGAILLYMLFRFKFTSGVAATVGLLHDVLVMFALTIIFQVQINAAFIAALITVIGYSLNNTLILFDRVRNMEKNNEKRLTPEMLTDQAVKDTFGRTMNTMITTLVPIFVLIVAGVPAIRDFALPIFFGLVAGTFSTIFLTTSLYVRFENARKITKSQKKVYQPTKTPAPAVKKTFKLKMESETAEG